MDQPVFGDLLVAREFAAHWASDSGGTMPMTGFHSVIDRPERVSREIPPTTTIAKINAQQANSHAATAPCRVLSAAAVTAPGRLAIVEKDTQHSCENDRLRAR